MFKTVGAFPMQKEFSSHGWGDQPANPICRSPWMLPISHRTSPGRFGHGPFILATSVFSASSVRVASFITQFVRFFFFFCFYFYFLCFPLSILILLWYFFSSFILYSFTFFL
jgi:hypothetical protein